MFEKYEQCFCGSDGCNGMITTETTETPETPETTTETDGTNEASLRTFASTLFLFTAFAHVFTNQ